MSEEKLGGNGELKTAGQIKQDDIDAQKKKDIERKAKESPKDYKIAEIWIKNDTVALEASPNFWMDKLRAIGVLEYCKEIVKDYNPAQTRKNNLVKQVNPQGFRKFIKGIGGRKR